MRHVAQLLLMCDGHDIGLSIDGGSLERSTRTGGRGGVPEALAAEPNVFIYDNYPGGIGFSRPLFEMHDLLLERTRELIDGCPCDSGCPSCVGPEGNTGPHAKARRVGDSRPARGLVAIAAGSRRSVVRDGRASATRAIARRCGRDKRATSGAREHAPSGGPARVGVRGASPSENKWI